MDFSFLYSSEPPEKKSDQSERRRTGRLLQEEVKCNLGVVLDISAGGMRIETAEIPEKPETVIITDDDHEIEVNIEVVWTKPLKDDKHEVGLRFLNADPALLRQIARISVSNRSRRTA